MGKIKRPMGRKDRYRYQHSDQVCACVHECMYADLSKEYEAIQDLGVEHLIAVCDGTVHIVPQCSDQRWCTGEQIPLQQCDAPAANVDVIVIDSTSRCMCTNTRSSKVDACIYG